ncbi:MAG: IS4 family transposase [Candidatus Sericytochromatia bacterium]
MKLPETENQSPYQREAWSQIRALLPLDPELERLAREKGALCRRRGVKAAEVLLRVLLFYGCCKTSLRGLCEWARDSGWGRFTRNALRQRLQNAAPWLQHLLDWVLSQRAPSCLVSGLKVVLVDGTRLSPPGTKGTGWCAHTLLDPLLGQTLQLELTDRKGGEHLRRFRFRAGELVIADSGYAHRRGLAHVVTSQAQFLVRTNWCNLPFETRHGRTFDLFAATEHLVEHQCAEFAVRIQADKDHGLAALPCRLLVYRKSEEAAEAARKKVRAEAKRKKRTPDKRTLEACQYVLLVTNVERWRLDAEELLELYRLRWQIELGFKRWKSLLHLDEMTVRQSDSVRATLTAKLLGAVLVESIVSKRAQGKKLWSLTREVGDAFQQALKGESAVAAILQGRRSVPDSERDPKRIPQREGLLGQEPAYLKSRLRQSVPA